MGLDQPAFDILAWNADSTRLSAAMHSFYLRCLYLRDELARGEMELAVQQLALSDLKSDAGIVNPPEARSPSTRQPAKPPQTPRSRALAPPGRAAPGGRTGPHGRRRGPVIASSRPPWAAASTRRPGTRPVNTYAADSERRRRGGPA